MPNVDELRGALRKVSGGTEVANFGVIDEGRSGYADCRVSAGIESWQGMYRLWIQVTHSKGGAGSKTRVVKWPYSDTSPKDLDRVIADLQFIENVTAPGRLPDERGWFARLFDRITGTVHLGEYRLQSPLDDEQRYGGKVVARILRWRDQLEVSLTEGRQSGVIVIAQLPHRACAVLRRALADFSRE